MQLNEVIQAMVSGCHKLAIGPLPETNNAGQAVEERLRAE